MGLFRRRPNPSRPPAAPGVAPAPPAIDWHRLGIAPDVVVWMGATSIGDDVWAFPSPARRIARHWRAARALHPETGLWPVTMTDPEDLCSALPGGIEPEYDVARALSIADDLDLESALATLEELASTGSDEDPDHDSHHLLSPRGEAIGAWRIAGWTVLVPSPDSAEVPARLGWFGGVNHDIEPHIHTAVLRGWAERYGVEVAVLDGSQTMELVVPHPPTTMAECHRVALEQVRYCRDLLTQGDEDVHDLATGQVPSPSWHFWWD